ADMGLMLASRSFHLNRSTNGAALFLIMTPGFWLIALGAATLAALFGPGLYHRHIMRGRGALNDIRRASAFTPRHK
ncbi:MAG: hypothetical protein HYZ00_14365, partial [Candidatus Hydrogenedentes bacterium]|nr:hypothetical protein [Candidatus Hydrogenedentota bacterium]